MGVCCRSLKDGKILMKTGLGLVLAGHLNFLLGALVQGAVLRDVKVGTQGATVEYAISNIIALVAGLMAVFGGISAIVLSKNMKKQSLKWLLLVTSLFSCLLGLTSAVSVSLSMVLAISNSGYSLLTQCQINETTILYRITYECPFDPTRIYGTTLTLWVLLVVMSLVEMVFSARCFLASTAFLRLPCPWRKRAVNANKVRFRATEESAPTSPVRVSLPVVEVVEVVQEEAEEEEEEEEEPNEQHDLIDKATPTEETSDWM